MTKLNLSPRDIWCAAMNPALTSKTYIALTVGVKTGQKVGPHGGKFCSKKTACLLELNQIMSSGNFISIIQKLQ
jgi:hypothetical protein